MAPAGCFMSCEVFCKWSIRKIPAPPFRWFSCTDPSVHTVTSVWYLSVASSARCFLSSGASVLFGMFGGLAIICMPLVSCLSPARCGYLQGCFVDHFPVQSIQLCDGNSVWTLERNHRRVAVHVGCSSRLGSMLLVLCTWVLASRQPPKDLTGLSAGSFRILVLSLAASSVALSDRGESALRQQPFHSLSCEGIQLLSLHNDCTKIYATHTLR